jgi:hypothetical protein
MISQASPTKRPKKVASRSNQLDSLDSGELAPPLFDDDKRSYGFWICIIFLVIDAICRRKLSSKALYMTAESGGSDDKRYILYIYSCTSSLFPF